MEDISEMLNKSVNSMSKYLINQVVQNSMLNGSLKEKELLETLKILWTENFERGEESSVKIREKKRKLVGTDALSSFLTEQVTPLSKFYGTIGKPKPIMEIPASFAIVNTGVYNKRQMVKKSKCNDMSATVIASEQFESCTALPQFQSVLHMMSTVEDVILGMKVEVQLGQLLMLGGGVLSTLTTDSSSLNIDLQPQNLWTTARVVQINRGISSKRKEIDPSVAQIAVRLRLSSSQGLQNGGEVEATWPSEYIRVSELRGRNSITDHSHQLKDTNNERHSVVDHTSNVEMNHRHIPSSGNSTLDALELLLMGEDLGDDETKNDKDDCFDDMLRHSCGGGDSFDPLSAGNDEDDLDFFGLLGEDDDEDDELMAALTSNNASKHTDVSLSNPSLCIPELLREQHEQSACDETVVLAQLATGERVPFEQLQEAEHYASNMLRHRPRFDLLPPQASDPLVRSAARRSFTADRLSAPTSSGQQADLSSVRLSADEDPDVVISSDITIMGRLRKISRARQHYQFTLYDVYVREAIPSTSSQSAGQLHQQQQRYRDYILPVVRARLDGRALFVVTDDDLDRQLLAQQRKKRKAGMEGGK